MLSAKRVLLGTIATFARLQHARAAEVRLYTPRQPLAAATALTLSDDQRRYLGTVMRFKVGDECLVFNGEDGEWLARVGVLDKKACELTVIEQLRPQLKVAQLHIAIPHGELEVVPVEATHKVAEHALEHIRDDTLEKAWRVRAHARRLASK